ncbi:hypothetical protein [Planosporangium mesophilum]|uniref:Uncharacterized protein n=1 Tax=Planosporangium mesophilum TaxID=689768 RepID=A0A8J3T5R7_9ACTN|nr:hypothetical protein [Planosporangium mesophilum]NJC81929.1 hypothetical protein [Planosporangium mesophilum]GII20409.1 hypothetical protein Pme01_00060 [Planosporangium mesophilum]
MLQVLPHMAREAPPEYVAFVARHLTPLRHDAARVVGDERDADLLYPDVLTDVAARWGRLELSRTLLRRPGAADEYLQQAFQRRSERWRSAVEFEPLVEIWVSTSDVIDWPNAPASPETPADPTVPPARSNAATRLAPYLRPKARIEVGPVAEAAVAWWHAYEAHRHRVHIAWLVVGVVLLLFALRYSLGVGAWGE